MLIFPLKQRNLVIICFQIPGRGRSCVAYVSEINICLFTSLIIKCWFDPVELQAYFCLSKYETQVSHPAFMFRDYTEVINNVVRHDQAFNNRFAMTFLLHKVNDAEWE